MSITVDIYSSSSCVTRPRIYLGISIYTHNPLASIADCLIQDSQILNNCEELGVPIRLCVAKINRV